MSKIVVKKAKMQAGHDDAGETGGFEGSSDKNMSESELEELQKKNCVFCHIASGKVPAKKVYEDEQCIAVLDINPASPGHVLLMPKEHHTIMFQVPDGVLGHIFVIAKALSQAGLKAFQTKGTTILAANGVAAGQRAPHFMIHVIPRMTGDSVGIYIPSRALPEKEAGQIAAALSAALGWKARAATAAAAAKAAGDAGEDEVEKQKWQDGRHAEAEVVEESANAADKKKDKPGRHGQKESQRKKSDLDTITDFLAKGGSP